MNNYYFVYFTMTIIVTEPPRNAIKTENIV